MIGPADTIALPMLSVPDLPRFRLFDGPSPLTPLPRFAEALGGGFELWAKREDLLPLAFGGNKLRNLEFLVGRAIAEGADALVTSGRRWSNHCRLTAAAGAKAGLEVHLVLSGPPAPDAFAGMSPGRRLDALLGATIHQAATADRAERESLVMQTVDDLRATGRRPSVIGVGGGGAVGAVGQALAASELLDQAHEAGWTPDLVVLPTATGGTQAGLVAGFAACGAATGVHGVVVAHTAAELRLSIEATLQGVAEVLGIATPGPTAIVLDESQAGPGYGVRSESAEEATSLLARTEGLFVDPIYTAKALAAVVGLARASELQNRRVVFWHAGGLPGMFEPLEEAR